MTSVCSCDAIAYFTYNVYVYVWNDNTPVVLKYRVFPHVIVYRSFPLFHHHNTIL